MKVMVGRTNLFKDGACGENLKGKGERIHREQVAEFDPSDSGSSTTGGPEEAEDKEEADCTDDNLVVGK
jgi:hypothetical protein